MKKYKSHLFLVLFAIALAACSTTKNTATVDGDTSPSLEELVLNIKFTSNYCGGAPPPDDLIQRLRTPKNLASEDIYISTQNKLNDDLIKVKTDANGKLTTSLEVGTYFLYLPNKVNATLKKSGDATRCKEWKNKPNGEFTVSKGTSDIEIAIVKTCDSCGAMPQ